MKLNKIYELRIQNYKTGGYTVVRPPMTIEFVIERNTYASANQANIKIYNLSEKTRALLFQDRIIGGLGAVSQNAALQGNIELYAGYESDAGNLSCIFNGWQIYTHSTRRGTEFITETECQDPGVYAYITESIISLERNATRSKAEIIAGLYNDLGYVNQGIIGPSYESIPFISSSRGLSIISGTMKMGTEITKDDGKFFFDLNRPVSLSSGEAFINDTFGEITPDTGLLNVPVRSDLLVVANLMFTPQLQVGQYVKVQAYSDDSYNGDYAVEGLRHSGMISGTHDAPTSTTVYLTKNMDREKLFTPKGLALINGR